MVVARAPPLLRFSVAVRFLWNIRPFVQPTRERYRGFWIECRSDSNTHPAGWGEGEPFWEGRVAEVLLSPNPELAAAQQMTLLFVQRATGSEGPHIRPVGHAGSLGSGYVGSRLGDGLHTCFHQKCVGRESLTTLQLGRAGFGTTGAVADGEIRAFALVVLRKTTARAELAFQFAMYLFNGVLID